MSSNASGAVLLLVVVSILLSVGIWSTATAIGEQSTDTRITNETVEVSEGWSDLNATAERYHSESVENDTDVLERDVDYFWRADDGQIAFNTSRQLSGTTVNVSYTATELPEETGRIVSLLAPIWQMGSVVPLIAVGGALFAGLSYLGSQRGRGGAY